MPVKWEEGFSSIVTIIKYINWLNSKYFKAQNPSCLCPQSLAHSLRQLTERSEVSDPFVKIVIKKKRIIFLPTMTKLCSPFFVSGEHSSPLRQQYSNFISLSHEFFTRRDRKIQRSAHGSRKRMAVQFKSRNTPKNIKTTHVIGPHARQNSIYV